MIRNEKIAPHGRNYNLKKLYDKCEFCKLMNLDQFVLMSSGGLKGIRIEIVARSVIQQYTMLVTVLLNYKVANYFYLIRKYTGIYIYFSHINGDDGIDRLKPDRPSSRGSVASSRQRSKSLDAGRKNGDRRNESYIFVAI